VVATIIQGIGMLNHLNRLAMSCWSIGLACGAIPQAIAQETQAPFTSTYIDYTLGASKAVDINNNGLVLFNETGSFGYNGAMYVWDSANRATRPLPFTNAKGVSIDDAGGINGYQFQASANNPSGSSAKVRFDSVTGYTSVGWSDEKLPLSIPSNAKELLNAYLSNSNTATYRTGVSNVIATNDRGQLLAEGSSLNALNAGAGTSYWVAVFTPVPEASKSTLLLIGLCAVGWVARPSARTPSKVGA
jgi:hypothetical protein